MFEFKRRSAVVPNSPDDAIAAKRLHRVAGRGKSERALYPVQDPEPQIERVKRLFWTPDEWATES
jgi:hypothetical protein